MVNIVQYRCSTKMCNTVPFQDYLPNLVVIYTRFNMPNQNVYVSLLRSNL